MKDKINLLDWYAVNRKTGETVELDILTIKSGGDYNKIFVKEFAKTADCGGVHSMKILTYLLKQKDHKNIVHKTQREMASECNVTLPTVTRVISKLAKTGFLRIKRSAYYIINPDVIHYGGTGNKIAILRMWNDLDDIEQENIGQDL